MSRTENYDDLVAILGLRALLAGVDPAGRPQVAVVSGRIPAAIDQLAILAGSFNPLTPAHVALVQAARRAGYGHVCFALSKVTVGKEQPIGATLEDRLLVLQHYAARHGAALAVTALNRGLYIDQAIAFRHAFPALKQLAFVVGFDKIVEIFDTRYYAGREAALDTLFDQASFLMAPRSGADAADLDRVLDRGINRRYAAHVATLPISARYSRASSSRLRGALASGRVPRHLLPEVADFVAATGAYQAARVIGGGEHVDRYALRIRLIDLLSRAEEQSAFGNDFGRLLGLLTSPTAGGERLRSAVALEDAPALAAVREASS